MTPRLCALIVVCVLAAGCRFSLNPDVDPNRDGGGFTCADDSDCGDGWHCNLDCHAAGFAPYCLPNGECDPCPDLQTDIRNCGRCANACSTGSACISGTCVPPPI